MKFAEKSYRIFEQSVADYHIDDDVDAPTRQPYAPESIEGVLYAKNRIDAVQWHLEDIIRDPEIDPVAALALKRRIDYMPVSKWLPTQLSTPRVRHGRSTACRFSLSRYTIWRPR